MSDVPTKPPLGSSVVSQIERSDDIPIDVNAIANLCYLEVVPERAHHLKQELTDILNYVKALSAYDTHAVEPMSHVHVGDVNELREDELIESLNREEVLSCAPDRKGAFYKVPLIIES